MTCVITLDSFNIVASIFIRDNLWRNRNETIFKNIHMTAKETVGRVLQQLDAIAISIKYSNSLNCASVMVLKNPLIHLAPHEVGAYKLTD
ncbi:hypothetical protein JHK82_036216 [Glycine max]|uniref:Uncharacterized protein n=2 Tax=Glycine subgen. Soja TaxID=1462606 RepID=A0A0R0GUP9_SOYBN|nr:hypothetical protein JHK82_036216 [Glycine max]KAG5130227.1 hypothetical protein JHK84_036624 [Glycine max]KAH1101440.1 hypothetical protein GYH30_036149 [Glycine max]RZB72476.1 hypothetical protein D0Y65_036647 [Glycine soja]